jgi:predicted AlkP superfamily pyrophosphatase or phosphodiesterase
MPFLSSFSKRGYHKELENVLGYSFAIQSSMLSGKYPDENLHWMPYYYSPTNSPMLFKIMAKFGRLSSLDKLPNLRYLMERTLRTIFTKRGAQANNIPFSVIDKISIYPYYYMNELPFYCELEQLLSSKYASSLTYIGPPKIRGDNMYHSLLEHIKRMVLNNNNTEILLVYEDRLDGVGHAFGPFSSEYKRCVRHLDRTLMSVYQKLKDNFGQYVTVYFFSDHGQSQLTNSFDIISKLTEQHLKLAEHYICFIDATIALFWPRNELVQEKLENLLDSLKIGTLIDEKLREKYHLKFRGKDIYGSHIYVLKPGWTFFPNFFSPFGVMKGLHGYLPENQVQKSLLISNRHFDFNIFHVKDLRKLVIKIVSDLV